jgi:uncharacterized membrane protein
MPELIVVGFEGIHRAAEVLSQLQELNAEQLIELKDGVAVYRTDDGRLRVNHSVQPTTRDEAVWGGLLGAFIGVLLASPFALAAVPVAATAALTLGGAAVGAVGGAVAGFDDAATWKEEFGISDEFVKQVGALIQSGQSAVFVIVRASDPNVVAEQFELFGGTVLRTTLSPERTKKFRESLAGGSEESAR